MEDFVIDGGDGRRREADIGRCQQQSKESSYVHSEHSIGMHRPSTGPANGYLIRMLAMATSCSEAS